MKTIRFIATLILLLWCFVGFPLAMAGCKARTDSRRTETEVILTYKHKIGDIVYLKPDSVRAVIEGLTDTNENLLINRGDVYPVYELYYFMKDGTKVTEKFREELIY